MRKILLILLILFVTVSMLQSVTGCSADELSDIIAAAEKCDQTVISGKGSYIWENNTKTGNQKKFLVDFAFNGPKVSWTIFVLNLNGKYFPDSLTVPYEHHTFDNKISCHIFYYRNSEGLYDPKLIRAGIDYKEIKCAGFPYSDPIDPRFIGMGIAGDPVGVLLKRASEGSYEDLKFKNLRFMGNDTVDGIECKKVGYTINESEEWTLWLAPSRMYRILKSEQKTESGNILSGHITYQKFDNGAWFPNKATLQFSSSGSTFRWTYNDDWKINVSLPDSMFVIDFPENVKVSQ